MLGRLDCYECETSELARPLYERLEVEAVPSVMIFDGEGVTRLARYSCKPANFKKIVAKVRVAMLSMKKRRSLHRLFGTRLLETWVLDTDGPAYFGAA